MTTEINIDSVIDGGLAISVDAVISSTNTVTPTIKGVIWSSYEATTSLDAVIFSSGVSTSLDAVIKGVSYTKLSGVINAGPNVVISGSFDAGKIRNYVCEPLESSQGNSGFFNVLTLRYNKMHDGDFASSMTLKAVSSVNYYNEEIRYGVDLDLIYDQNTALRIGHELLTQHSIIPLKISFDYDFSLFDLETMDFAELNYPYGFSSTGLFSNLLCRVKDVSTDYVNGQKSYTLITDQYLSLSKRIVLSNFSSSSVLRGAGIDIVGGISKTIIITSDTAGNTPIAGAEVTILGVTRTTDTLGQVVFQLNPGSYTATIKAAGYLPSVLTVIV